VAGKDNSKKTRVEPVFGWFEKQADPSWPAQLLRLAEGLAAFQDPGILRALTFHKEVAVLASGRRLAWMIENAERLAPQDGRRWTEVLQRAHHPKREKALEVLKAGARKGVPEKLILEGSTKADCIIECTHAVIWVEGKRNDWLTPSTTWDVMRDQLARNLEATWILGNERQKDFCVLVVHEHPLKHHERLLVEGYRAGTWTGGVLHLDEATRKLFQNRIGTVTWTRMAEEWPALKRVMKG